MWRSLSSDLPPGLRAQEAPQEMTSELEEQELPREGGWEGRVFQERPAGRGGRAERRRKNLGVGRDETEGGQAQV